MMSCSVYMNKYFYDKNDELKRRIKRINDIQQFEIPVVSAENIIINRKRK